MIGYRQRQRVISLAKKTGAKRYVALGALVSVGWDFDRAFQLVKGEDMCDAAVASETDVREAAFAPKLLEQIRKTVCLSRRIEEKADRLRLNLIGSIPSNPENMKDKEPESFMEAVSLLNGETQQRLQDAETVLEVLLHHFPDPEGKDDPCEP